MIDLEELIKESHDRAKRKGWYDPPQTDAEFLLNLHAEISEATESERANEPVLWFREDGKPEGIAVELGDVIIRICDRAGFKGLPLVEAIIKKSEYNESRPTRHGGKKF